MECHHAVHAATTVARFGRPPLWRVGALLPTILHSQKTEVVWAAWEAAKVGKEFAASRRQQKVIKAVWRENMTDYDRFKLARARVIKNGI